MRQLSSANIFVNLSSINKAQLDIDTPKKNAIITPTYESYLSQESIQKKLFNNENIEDPSMHLSFQDSAVFQQIGKEETAEKNDRKVREKIYEHEMTLRSADKYNFMSFYINDKENSNVNIPKITKSLERLKKKRKSATQSKPYITKAKKTKTSAFLPDLNFNPDMFFTHNSETTAQMSSDSETSTASFSN